MERLGSLAFKIIKWFSIAFTALFLVIMFTPAANRMARPLVVAEMELKKADVIAVLGGGVYENGALGGASNERLIHGLLLYKKGYGKRLFFSGGSIFSRARKIMHTVAMSSDASAIGLAESEVMKDTASVLGIPGADLASDPYSTDTYENIRNLKAYMSKNGLSTCILVTSATHMRRASMAARKLEISFQPSYAKDTAYLRTSATGRLSLMREILWEYSALALYRIYGYI